jgi:tetratricopeptide (TPR) repeat protein
MSERYIYLASAGFCVLLALALIRISQFTGRILPDKLQQPLLVIWILVVVTGYGMKTFTRNKDWRSEIVFWQKTSQIDPKNGVVWYQLGKAYQNQSQVQPAIDAYTQAVTLIPKFTNAYELLGNVYQSRFEYDKALESYESAMKINPNLPETINNVARVYFDLAKLQIGKNDYSSVKELLTDALKMNPDYADAAHLYEELCREKRIECL